MGEGTTGWRYDPEEMQRQIDEAMHNRRENLKLEIDELEHKRDRLQAASARTARVSAMFADLWNGIYHNSGNRFVNERNLPDVWADAEMIVDYQIKKEGGGE